MKITSIDTTLSVFWNMQNLDTLISRFSSIYPIESFERSSQNEIGPNGIQYQVYIFRNKKITIVLRPNRLDISYAIETDVNVDELVNTLDHIDNMQKININRIALNHAGFIQDLDYSLLENFKNNLNLSNYSIKDELTLRFNSVRSIMQLEINDITTFHSGIVTNNATFEKIHAIVINKDINTIPEKYIYTNILNLKSHFECLIKLLNDEKDAILKLVCGGESSDVC